MDDLKKQYLSMTVSDLQNLLQNAVLTPEALSLCKAVINEKLGEKKYSEQPEIEPEPEKLAITEKLYIDACRQARMGGDTVFQIVLPLSKTAANVLPMIDAFTLTNDKNHSKLISAIEREGWKLDNASYVYRITRIESRDKFLASGQQEAVGGQIVAIYIFRATQCEHNAIKGR